MRVAISVALVLAAVTLIARANEAPTPAADVSPQAIIESGETYYSDAPQVAPTEPARTITAQPDGAIVGDSQPSGIAATAAKVCVVLKQDSFEVKLSNKQARRGNPAAFLLCDSVTTESTPGGMSTLKCQNCELTLPNGVKVNAGEITFHVKSNTLTLVGTDESPVELSIAGTVTKAPRLEMKVDPKAWGTTYGAPVMQGQVLGTITPVRPQPQSRY